MTMRLAYENSAAYSAPRAAVASGIGGLLSNAMTAMARWQFRQREHRAMLRLDDHLMRDIGVDRTQIETMAARAFWRA